MNAIDLSSLNSSQCLHHRDPAPCLAARRRKLLPQFQKTKTAILAEFDSLRESHEHLLLLALAEAEGLAWQSGYPELVFPTLAREKANALAAWRTRQELIRQTAWAASFAA